MTGKALSGTGWALLPNTFKVRCYKDWVDAENVSAVCLSQAVRSTRLTVWCVGKIPMPEGPEDLWSPEQDLWEEDYKAWCKGADLTGSRWHAAFVDWERTYAGVYQLMLHTEHREADDPVEGAPPHEIHYYRLQMISRS